MELFVSSPFTPNSYCEDVSERRSLPQSSQQVLCCVICVPIVLRYWHSFAYALASKRAQRRGDRAAQIGYYERLIHHDSDVALIRIFECYLEVAPQKCLQIYIMLRSASASDVTGTYGVPSCVVDCRSNRHSARSAANALRRQRSGQHGLVHCRLP